MKIQTDGKIGKKVKSNSNSEKHICSASFQGSIDCTKKKWLHQHNTRILNKHGAVHIFSHIRWEVDLNIGIYIYRMLPDFVLKLWKSQSIYTGKLMIQAVDLEVLAWNHPVFVCVEASKSFVNWARNKKLVWSCGVISYNMDLTIVRFWPSTVLAMGLWDILLNSYRSYFVPWP